MIDRTYGYIEGNVLRWETARRGRRHAAAVESDPDAIETLDALASRIGDAKVISFDLFDTLLHRRAFAPEAIHRKTAGFARLIAGERAGQVILAARHRLHRQMKAEMLSSGEGDEPPLTGLFMSALRLAGVAEADAVAARLVAFETRVESRGIEAAAGASALLSSFRKSGHLLIATSDMYLPEGSIRSVLSAAGLEKHFDHVFVSADHKWTKASGRLFGIVSDRLGASPHEVLHVGDRIDSDVRQARAAGWKAIHFHDGVQVATSEAARIAESHVPSPALRRSQIKAALDCASDAALGSIDEIVEQLIGPAAGLLTLQALGVSSQIGARHLFHLTRDATIIGEIAASAQSAHPHLAPEGLTVRELAISRTQGALLGLRVPADLRGLSTLLPYLTDFPASARALRTAFGLPETAFTDRIRAAEGPAFMAMVSEAEEANLLIAALAIKREAVETYLRGSGILDPDPSVVVDIGYAGTFGAQLSHLFFAEPLAGRRVESLFMMTSRALTGNQRQMHPQIHLRQGLILNHRAREARWASANFAWLEPFMVDPDRGRLIGYDGSRPVFDAPSHDEATRRALGKMRSAIRARAARFIAEFHEAPGDLDEIAALLRRRFARFAGRPRGAEVRALRGLSHQSGQSALMLRDPTRRINPLRLLPELSSLRGEDYWVQGSLKRSGLGVLNTLLSDLPARDQRADPRQSDT